MKCASRGCSKTKAPRTCERMRRVSSIFVLPDMVVRVHKLVRPTLMVYEVEQRSAKPLYRGKLKLPHRRHCLRVTMLQQDVPARSRACASHSVSIKASTACSETHAIPPLRPVDKNAPIPCAPLTRFSAATSGDTRVTTAERLLYRALKAAPRLPALERAAK